MYNSLKEYKKKKRKNTTTNDPRIKPKLSRNKKRWNDFSEQKKATYL